MYSEMSVRYLAGTALKSRVEKTGLVARSVKCRLSITTVVQASGNALAMHFQEIYLPNIFLNTSSPGIVFTLPLFPG